MMRSVPESRQSRQPATSARNPTRNPTARSGEAGGVTLCHAWPQTQITNRTNFHFMRYAQMPDDIMPDEVMLSDDMLRDEAIHRLYDGHSLVAEINGEDGTRHCLYADGTSSNGTFSNEAASARQEQYVLVLSYPLESSDDSHTDDSQSDDSQDARVSRPHQASEVCAWLREQLFTTVSYDLMMPQQRLDTIAQILAKVAARRAHN